MQRNRWVWMPHPGHFIMGSSCRFRLNTFVGKYIVSTVGELWPDSAIRKIHAECRGIVVEGKGDEYDFNYMKAIGYEDLGMDRKYETMVFPASKNENKDQQCCPYRVAQFLELDSKGYNDPGEAYKGHMKMCERWSKK